MKSEKKEQVFLIGKDAGYVRKIAFINKESKDFPTRSLSEIMPIVEQSGNSPKFLGFLASAPTIYLFMSNFSETTFETYYRYQGSLYERHTCPHPDVIVYCHIMKLDEYQAGSAAGKFFKDLMTEFPNPQN